MKHLIIILLIVSTIHAAVRMQDDWVDPHNMNTNVKQKYLPKLKKSSSSSSLDDKVIDPMPNICMSHLKRVVSVLMNSAYLDKRDLDMYHGQIRFNIHPSDYEFLVNFAKNDLTLDNLRKLDTTLNNSFRRSYIDDYLDTIESFQLKLYSIVMNLQNLWFIGMLGILYFVYQLFKNDFSLVYICKYLTIMLLIIDFGFRYNHLLEEVAAHNLEVVYSSQCDTSKMSWTEYVKYAFGPTDCAKKSVSPLDVCLFQVKSLIIVPMHAFGTGMGGFGKNMFTSLPWGLNLIIWPILLVFTLVLLLFAMTILSGQSIEINMLHVVKLKFGGGAQKENILTMPAVERLMDKILHRPIVQNVHVGLPYSGNQKSDTEKKEILEKEVPEKDVTKETPDPQESHGERAELEEKNDENNETFLEQINQILNNTEDISLSGEADNTDESEDSKKVETLK